MKLVILSVLAVVALATALPAEKEKEYTNRWDTIDLDQILNSDRLLNNYIKCLLNKGRCTPDGSELKRTLPEALASDCAKCTSNQKKGSDKVVRFLIKNKRADWDKLEKLYDPDQKYKARYPDVYNV